MLIFIVHYSGNRLLKVHLHTPYLGITVTIYNVVQSLPMFIHKEVAHKLLKVLNSSLYAPKV